MRVLVRLTNGQMLEGDSQVFEQRPDYRKPYNEKLLRQGFWLSNWRYTNEEAVNKRLCFVPWAQILVVEPAEDAPVLGFNIRTIQWPKSVTCPLRDECEKIAIVLDKSFDDSELYGIKIREICDKCGEIPVE